MGTVLLPDQVEDYVNTKYSCPVRLKFLSVLFFFLRENFWAEIEETNFFFHFLRGPGKGKKNTNWQRKGPSPF